MADTNGNGKPHADGTDDAALPGQTLTTRQGHPVSDNQNTRTVGSRGPTTMENYQLLEKITHFDRERIPERVVHARGAGAHGFFETYGTVGGEPVEKYTRAKVFSGKGKRTPTFTRFSSVIHGGHSPETLRDPRGFATKFYTETGNWDLVGNNLKVFFIRDALKFPDMVHAFKPDPVTNRQSSERFFDFLSVSPEATHMMTFLFSPKGIPANYREMNGAGVNTYKWVNADGVGTLVKYHWVPKQGERNLTQEQANAIQATEFNHASADLYDAIERGRLPRVGDAGPADARRRPPGAGLRPAGRHEDLAAGPVPDAAGRAAWCWTATRRTTSPRSSRWRSAPACWSTGWTSATTRCSRAGRSSYSDTQRYRVGPNYLQLPINRPKAPVATNQRDGQMTYYVDAGPNKHVNYEPSRLGGLKESAPLGKPHEPHYDADLTRAPIDRLEQLRPGRADVPRLRGVGAGRAGEQHRPQPGPVHPGHPGRDPEPLHPGRRRLRPAGDRGHAQAHGHDEGHEEAAADGDRPGDGDAGEVTTTDSRNRPFAGRRLCRRPS